MNISELTTKATAKEKSLQPYRWPQSPHMLLLTIILLTSISAVSAQGVLENPQPGSVESGVGLLSGWYCDATTIDLVIDARPPKMAAYGTSRRDTETICGDDNNGFGLLFNYNLLGAGTHTVRALADGVEFASVTFTVTTLGQEFVTDMDAGQQLNLITLAQRISLRWQESKQNFVIEEAVDLGVSPDDALNAFVKPWTGTWQSPLGSGSISAIVERMGNELRISSFEITGTGCPGDGSSEVFSPNFSQFNVILRDDSVLQFGVYPTAGLSAIAGTFIHLSGPCAGLEGAFIVL